MGRYAVRTALRFDFVDEIVVADLEAAAARDFAASCGAKCRSQAIDVRDERALIELLSGAAVVLNTVGPFFRLGPPVLRAAIAAGCHYIDVNDDWESTLAMLAMDGQVRAAGLTALIGMGASPGICNLLAVRAQRELDRVEEIYTGWDLDAAMPETIGSQPCAATLHAVHQLTGTIRVYEGGRFADVRPIRRRDLDYPGLGVRSGWTIGHPEAITFPRSYPGLRTSLNVMSATPATLFALRLITGLVDLGWITDQRAARWIERLEVRGGPVKTPEDYVREMIRGKRRRLPPLFALARGQRSGRPAAVAAAVLSAPAVGMGGATGVPLALGLSLVRPDRAASRGLFAPEQIIDPDAFFAALAPLCTPACPSGEDLVLVSRSWEPVDLALEIARRFPGRA
jgi:saccharopine dehydrogenase-like NADP-dependent oxidoreductase